MKDRNTDTNNERESSLSKILSLLQLRRSVSEQNCILINQVRVLPSTEDKRIFGPGRFYHTMCFHVCFHVSFRLGKGSGVPMRRLEAPKVVRNRNNICKYT